MKKATNMDTPFKKILLGLACSSLMALPGSLQAVEIITFDEAIDGLSSFSFDGNNDSLADVIFSTTDPMGFNTSGPGSNMSYISEPGLEGTTELGPDLRVDFLGGAINNVTFGFAVSEGMLEVGEEDMINTLPMDPFGGVDFTLFDENDNVLANGFQQSFFSLPDGMTPSNFPENLFSLNFPGVASYGEFDFESGPGRYIIDNFTGTFDAAAPNVAPPGSLPETALLPDNTGDPFFNFAINVGEGGLGTEFPVFIDPDFATAYEYQVAPGSPLVVKVLVPAPLSGGDGMFTLEFGSSSFDLFAGVEFDIAANNGGMGVDFFRISGISLDEMLDPTNPLAFVTGLTFEQAGLVNITQTPITSPAVDVPEPGSLPLVALCLLVLARTRKHFG